MTDKLYEGYHADADLPFKKGDRVRVKKGARLFSTHPQKGGYYESYRSQVVTVKHMMRGQTYMPPHITEGERDRLELKGFGEQLAEMDRLRKTDMQAWHNFRIHTRNPRVVWAGTGGYWIEADVNDVEEIEDEAS